MNKRVLGRTLLEVSELALGGLFIATHFTTLKEAIGLVASGIERGINFFDTAPSYYDSEEVLGKALQNITAPYYISTKLCGLPGLDLKNTKQLRISFENSLKRLNRDSIDILYIHEPDRPGQNDWWDDIEKLDGPVLHLLFELKKEKLIKYFGLGGTTTYHMAKLIDSDIFDVVLTAFNYSLLWREAEREIIPTARKRHVGIVMGSPLQQGALSKKHEEAATGAWWLHPLRQKQLQLLYDLADNLHMSLPELGLRFVLSNPHISTVLAGAASQAEIIQNAEYANKGPLTADVIERLNAIYEILPNRPFEEPFFMPFGRPYHGPWRPGPHDRSG